MTLLPRNIEVAEKVYQYVGAETAFEDLHAWLVIAGIWSSPRRTAGPDQSGNRIGKTPSSARVSIGWLSDIGER